MRFALVVLPFALAAALGCARPGADSAPRPAPPEALTAPPGAWAPDAAAPEGRPGLITFRAPDDGRSSLGPAAIFWLAVDDRWLFWNDGRGRLWRAPKGGGDPTLLADDTVMDFVLDGGDVYYAGDRVVKRISKQGGAATTIVAESEDPLDLCTDGLYLYYGMFDGSPVRKVAKSGGKPTFLLPGEKHATLDVHGGWLYVSSYKRGLVLKVPTAGGKPVVLARGEARPVGMAVDDSGVYFPSETEGTVRRVGLEGGPVVTLAKGQQNHDIFVLDERHLYWGTWRDSGAGHALMRVAKAGGEAEVVLDGLQSPTGIAVDEHRVWVASRGEILSVPK